MSLKTIAFWAMCDITCLYYFGSDMEADPPALRCITKHPLFQPICLQREVLKTAFVGLCQVLGTAQSAPNRFDTGQVWVNLPFKYAPSHSLKSSLFLRAVDESLSIFWNLWAFCLNTQPQHIWSFWSWCCLPSSSGEVRSDVMLGAQAFNMASKMADVLIILVRSFLLLQSG